MEIIHTCEKCSMKATYADAVGLDTHYYCDHHKTSTSKKIIGAEASGFRKLVPLISIFVIIIILTIGTATLQDHFSTHHLMSLLMGYFFVIFGAFKVLNIKNFAVAYQDYDVIAKRSVTYAYAYPFIEVILGIMYFLNIGGIYRDGFVAILMLVGTYGVWKVLQDKNYIPCACLGMVFKVPMTKVTLLENLVMAAMALYMVIGALLGSHL